MLILGVRFGLLITILFLSSCAGSSKPSICEILKLKYCNDSKRSLNRSAGASLPSVNAAAFNNPAAISLSKGLGVETIHYKGKAQIGLITGTGRVGAAISNFPNDGTFFGNTAVETANQYRQRAINYERFEQEKFVLAGAFNLFGGNKKRGLQADIGLIYRRQTEIEKDYFGGGLILSFNKILSLGASVYDDVYYQNLSGKKDTIVDQFGNPINVIYPTNSGLITETDYKVKSYVAGLKFSQLALDYITFTNTSKDQDIEQMEVNIYNVSWFYKMWIFSYGRRFEKSFKEVYEDEVFIVEKDKSDTFVGAQYATKSGIIVGGFINYYLFGELSLGLTYFF